MRIVVPIITLSLVIMLTLHYRLTADAVSDDAGDASHDGISLAEVIRRTELADEASMETADSTDNGDDTSDDAAAIASAPLDR